jgi:hypothetical protein
VIHRDDLKKMKPETIAAAFRAGDLDHLLAPESGEEQSAEAAPEPESGEAPGTTSNADQGARGTPARSLRAALQSMSPSEIVEAHRRGDLDALMRGQVR